MSPAAPGHLFRVLDLEWSVVQVSPVARRAWRRWRLAEPALRASATVADLVRENRSRRGREADPTLLALVRLARHEELAARVVLQLLLPGVVCLAGRVRWALGEDADSAAVAATWERIRTYPIERRKRSVAANVLLDARKRILATCRDAHIDAHLAGSRPAEGWTEARSREASPPRWVGLDGRVEAHASVELVSVLTEALEAGLLDLSEHDLLFARHVADVSADELAERHGTHPDTIRRRWRRAELRLCGGAVS